MKLSKQNELQMNNGRSSFGMVSRDSKNNERKTEGTEKKPREEEEKNQKKEAKEVL